jgi:hypothetical protein
MQPIRLSIITKTHEENVFKTWGPYDDVIDFDLVDGVAILTFPGEVVLKLHGATGFVRPA